MNQIWQYWKGGITSNRADLIIETGNEQPVANAALGFDGSTQNDQYRSSEIRWIPIGTDGHLDAMLWSFAQTANRNAFGFDISYLNDIQYTHTMQTRAVSMIGITIRSGAIQRHLIVRSLW